MMKKKIILVAGARPNFMKIAPIIRELKKQDKFIPILVHTGQHYDYQMSESFFKDLQIPEPDYFLNIGSGSHANQTGCTMIKFEEVCIKEKPELVIVVGDINATLACSIASKKLNIKVAHIEAGLRSFDNTMPEEINRIATDSICDYFFTTEPSANANLKKEGKKNEQIFFVGNTMIDSLVYGLDQLERIDPRKFSTYQLKEKLKKYGIVTLHRPSNVDSPAQLDSVIGAINSISQKLPLVFPIHPRTKKNLEEFKINLSANIHAIPPLGYLEFLWTYKDSAGIITDSGGIQEESTFLKIPCYTLRSNTERPATIDIGTNSLIGHDFKLLENYIDQLVKGIYKKGEIPELWDGKSSQRIVNILDKIL